MIITKEIGNYFCQALRYPAGSTLVAHYLNNVKPILFRSRRILRHRQSGQADRGILRKIGTANNIKEKGPAWEPFSFSYFDNYYFTSSKTTLTDYQCVSTRCCTHVAKTEITIDNQHVTNIVAKVFISPQTTKRKHRKNHKSATFFDLDWLWNAEITMKW